MPLSNPLQSPNTSSSTTDAHTSLRPDALNLLASPTSPLPQAYHTALTSPTTPTTPITINLSLFPSPPSPPPVAYLSTMTPQSRVLYTHSASSSTSTLATLGNPPPYSTPIHKLPTNMSSASESTYIGGDLESQNSFVKLDEFPQEKRKGVRGKSICIAGTVLLVPVCVVVGAVVGLMRLG